MKRRIIAAALTAACLSGCAQTASVPSPGTSAPTLSQAAGGLASAVKGALPPATAAKVQTIASRSCAFIPTLSTIANIFASGNRALTTAGSIASAICQALAAAPAGNGLGLLDARASGGGAPAVGKVLVHGKFKDGRRI